MLLIICLSSFLSVYYLRVEVHYEDFEANLLQLMNLHTPITFFGLQYSKILIRQKEPAKFVGVFFMIGWDETLESKMDARAVF